MSVTTRNVEYEHDGVALEGRLAWDDAIPGPRPGIVIVHDAMKGRDGFELGRARSLAELGHASFVVDLFGRDVHGESHEDAARLIAPFQADRALLFRRLQAGLDAARAQPEVDAGRVAAMGYCFGGLAALDLARGGAAVRGVASFHGLLTPPDPGTGEPFIPGRLSARILVLHGWEDPFVPKEQLEAFATEMRAAGADWELHAYGGAMHGFTNPAAQMPGMGAAYEARADRRSWRALTTLLEELFPDA